MGRAADPHNQWETIVILSGCSPEESPREALLVRRIVRSGGPASPGDSSTSSA
jgi:hypothetical protein